MRHTELSAALLRAQRLGREGHHEGVAPADTAAPPRCERGAVSQAGQLPWLLLLLSLAAHGYQMRRRRGVAKLTT